MKHLTYSELCSLKQASKPICSPNGKYVLFNVSNDDVSQNKKHTSLYYYDTDTEHINLFEEDARGKSYFWMDNEALCKVSKTKKNGPQTLFEMVEFKTSQERELFQIDEIISEYWYLGCNNFLLRGRKDYNPQGEGKCEYWVTHTEYPYKQNGAGYISGTRNTLYSLVNGTLKAVTKSLTQSESPVIISQDRTTIWNCADTYSGCSNIDQELYKLDVLTGKNVKIKERDECTYLGGVFLNGRVYIIKSFTKQEHVLNVNELWSFAADGTDWKKELNLSPAFSRYSMKCHNGTIYYINPIRSKSILMAWRPGGTPNVVYDGEISVDDFSLSAAGIFFVGRTAVSPGELYKLIDGKPVCISHLNDNFAEESGIYPPEPHSFADMDGFEIDGWCIKPIGYEKGKKYPAVLRIHGGPSGFYDGFYNNKLQYFAANGYFVIYANPRGSGTYTKEHMFLSGQYGTYDYEDLMMFVDEMLNKYTDIDPNKLCVTGGSYGGFMTNWIITHTNRFKAAVSLMSTSNWISKLLTCDNAHGKFIHLGAYPWIDPEKLWQHSPLKYINNVKTPTLFIQNQDDFRAPPGEAEQMFTALKLLNVPTKMIMNYKADHKNMNLIQDNNMQEQSLEWFNKYICD